MTRNKLKAAVGVRKNPITSMRATADLRAWSFKLRTKMLMYALISGLAKNHIPQAKASSPNTLGMNVQYFMVQICLKEIELRD